jgi:redox-sensitive bicupin YhaK (pirin superfamily)
MVEKVIHRASGRGMVQKGWLTTYHHFSFADFNDPDRLSFGTLKVIDENLLRPGKGFDMHSHENVEIITIPLEGSLEHMDTMGYGGVTRRHDIQVMSAGTGVYHSEFNHSHQEDLRYLQIWIRSKEYNISPHYSQMTFLPETMHNRFQLIASPAEKDGSLWINQDCFVSMGSFDRGRQVHYSFYKKGHGIYLYLLEGEVHTEGEKLSAYDGMGLRGPDSLHLEFRESTQIMLIEVPMY